MVNTGTEEIHGMADMKGQTQPTVIQTTSTESLSQNDPAPGPASTLTGLHPGQWNCFLVSSFTVCQVCIVFISVIYLLMQF